MAIVDVIKALRELETLDFGDLENYTLGLWSRRNLEAMLDDLEHQETKRAFDQAKNVDDVINQHLPGYPFA